MRIITRVGLNDPVNLLAYLDFCWFGFFVGWVTTGRDRVERSAQKQTKNSANTEKRARTKQEAAKAK